MRDQCLKKVEQLKLPSSYGSPSRLLDWALVEQRLVDSLHYWLATVRRDGSPHVVPVDGTAAVTSAATLRRCTSGTFAAIVVRRCTWRMGSRRSSSKALPNG